MRQALPIMPPIAAGRLPQRKATGQRVDKRRAHRSPSLLLVAPTGCQSVQLKATRSHSRSPHAPAACPGRPDNQAARKPVILVAICPAACAATTLNAPLCAFPKRSAPALMPLYPRVGRCRPCCFPRLGFPPWTPLSEAPPFFAEIHQGGKPIPTPSRSKFGTPSQLRWGETARLSLVIGRRPPARASRHDAAADSDLRVAGTTPPLCQSPQPPGQAATQAVLRTPSCVAACCFGGQGRSANGTLAAHTSAALQGIAVPAMLFSCRRPCGPPLRKTAREGRAQAVIPTRRL